MNQVLHWRVRNLTPPHRLPQCSAPLRWPCLAARSRSPRWPCLAALQERPLGLWKRAGGVCNRRGCCRAGSSSSQRKSRSSQKMNCGLLCPRQPPPPVTQTPSPDRATPIVAVGSNLERPTMHTVFTDLRIYAPPSPSRRPTRGRASLNQNVAGMFVDEIALYLTKRHQNHLFASARRWNGTELAPEAREDFFDKCTPVYPLPCGTGSVPA